MKARVRGRPKGSGGGSVAILATSDIRKVLQTVRRLGRYPARAEIAYLLSVEFGFRAGDLALLTVGDLFDGDGNVRVRWPTKSAEICCSTDVLAGRLSEYWSTHLAVSPDDSPLFPSQHGGGLTRASIARLLTSAYKIAGIVGGSSRSGSRTMRLIRSRSERGNAHRL